ncbi:hypothetical protein K8T06_15640 [bacterium]|nr:hypothetical protein [bacterium]
MHKNSIDYSISAACRAFSQMKIDECREIYEKIIADTYFDIEDRVISLQTLAQQEWKIYEDYERAKKKIKQALNLNIKKSKTWQILCQIEIEREQYNEALIAATNSLKASNTKIELNNSELAIASAILNDNLENLKSGCSLNLQDLMNVSSSLNKMINELPGKTVLSSLLFGISFCLGDGPGIMKAWKSFFYIYEGQEIDRLLAEPYAVLNSILPKWKNRDLTIDERRKLVFAFAQSRFYDYASLLVNSGNTEVTTLLMKDNEIYDIVAYADFIESFNKFNNYFYPQIARGLANYNESYDNETDNIAKTLWDKLHFPEKKPEFNRELFYDEIRKRYGTEGYCGTTVNYYCWLLGHVLHDEHVVINQYNYKARFRYISIGRMIIRDFTSWLGATNVGGWGNDSTVVEIRDSFFDTPFQIWNWVADKDKRLEMEAFCKSSIIKEYEVCKNDPYADPPGLSKRLKFNAAQRIYHEFNQKGLEGADLCLAFVSEYKRLNIESLTFAHEGRHAIDQAFFMKEFLAMSSCEREFRAKLSEVAFSSDPKLAITGSILGSSLGEDTDHEQANRKFRKLIVYWMTEHKMEIQSLDTNKPLIPQFYLLNNQQVIAMCQSADPLAKRNNPDQHDSA